MNPKESPKNLRAAGRKSQSGGPNRSRRTPSLSDAYSEILELPVPADMREIFERDFGVVLKPEARFADVSALRVLAKAVTGNVAAAREIRECTEGRPSERDESGGQSEVKIPVVYESSFAKTSWPAESTERDNGFGNENDKANPTPET